MFQELAHYAKSLRSRQSGSAVQVAFLSSVQTQGRPERRCDGKNPNIMLTGSPTTNPMKSMSTNPNRAFNINNDGMMTPSRSTQDTTSITTLSLDTGDRCSFCLRADDRARMGSILPADFNKKLVGEWHSATKTVPLLRAFFRLSLRGPAALHP